ncbi:MAG TPA: helix-turn-helix transcriptional regulator [Candidatus Limnocylindrales bacterium]
MSPRKKLREEAPQIQSSVSQIWLAFGLQVREARHARRWSVKDLAIRSGLSVAFVYLIEGGRSGSAEAAARIAASLGRRAELQLVDPRRREGRPSLSADPVHSAMGELEAARLAGLGFGVGIDEPYQHYQFAGRADLVAWDVDARALLHIENRTRFPDFQEMAGAFNAKREYLADSLAARAGVTTWRSQTHVIAALWSSEVLHALRLRKASFRALCPDPGRVFQVWWEGNPPKVGASSTLIVLDPTAEGRQRTWIALDDAMGARPRHRGYSDAAATLETNGSTAAARATAQQRQQIVDVLRDRPGADLG